MKRQLCESDVDDYIDTILEKANEICKIERSIFVDHSQMLKKLGGSHFVFTNRDESLSSKKWFWKNKKGDWEEQTDESNKLRLYISGNLSNLYDTTRYKLEEQFYETDPTEFKKMSRSISKKILRLNEKFFCLRENEEYQDRIIACAEELFYAVDIPPSIQQEEVTPESKKRATEEVIIQEKQPSTNKNTISSTMKRLVWNINIGEEIGKSKCLCCKTTDITQMSFHCGHVVANAKGGETIVSNLKPICQNCNSSMRTQNMNDFMISLK